MQRDDEFDSKGLRRRDVLAWLGATGGMLWAGVPGRRAAAEPDAAGGCVLTPRQTEGPYFVDERLERADLRLDPADGTRSAGIPLDLALRVSSVSPSGCVPIADAVVDVWHCDARGRYSGVRDPWFGGETDSGFLRGFLRSDGQGEVRFTTIYPGWYPGRAVHVHFKVRVGDRAGRAAEVTSQLYFDEAVTRRVYQEMPYSDRGSPPSNRQDGIFGYGGDALTLRPERTSEGYAARFDVGLRLA